MFVDLFPILSHNDIHSSKIFKLNPQLEEKLKVFVDIIKARLVKGNLNDTSNSLHSYLFELRLELIRSIESMRGLNELLSDKENDISHTIKEINSKTVKLVTENEKTSQESFYSILGPLLKEYQSIATSVLDSITNEPSVIPIDISKLKMSYETLKYIETLAPSFSYVRKMIDASLDFEFGLFVLDLLEDNEIIVKNEQFKQEIIPYLKNASSEYGTYAILANLWIPTNTQLDQPFFNRMKIKASIINCDSGNTVALSMDQLKKMMAS